MKYPETMLKKIEELAEDFHWDYDVVGIRVQEEPFELGHLSHVSHRWDNGEDTGEELDGLSVQSVSSLRTCKNDYYGDHVAIIVGDHYTYGEDAGEIVIEDPQVVAILA